MLESRFLAALVALTPVPAALQAAQPPQAPQDRTEPSPAEAETLLIRAERLIVRPGEELEETAILVQRGRIVAVGEGLVAPAGAREIEGAVVCAGLVDPWTSLGLDEGSRADDGTAAATATADGLDLWSTHHERDEALRGGVTAARVQAGARASIGGIGSVIHTVADTPEDAILLSDACIAASIGLTRDNPADVFDRLDEIDKLLAKLDKGKRYHEQEQEYERDVAEWEKEIAKKTEELEKDFKKAKKEREKKQKEAEEKKKELEEEKYKEDKKPRPPKFDAEAEAFARVALGELPLVVQLHRAEELRHLLAKTKDQGDLRLVLVGCTEAAPFAGELSEREIPVVLWPTPLGTGRPPEWAEHDLALASKLAAAGVRVLIGSGGARNPRDLRLLAALAVGHGLDRDQALEAITLAPARVFDLGDRIGSVEQGKEADLLVLDGDPLDSTTSVQFVISGGRVWSM